MRILISTFSTSKIPIIFEKQHKEKQYLKNYPGSSILKITETVNKYIARGPAGVVQHRLTSLVPAYRDQLCKPHSPF